jgi:hypothetical protein
LKHSRHRGRSRDIGDEKFWRHEGACFERICGVVRGEHRESLGVQNDRAQRRRVSQRGLIEVAAQSAA